MHLQFAFNVHDALHPYSLRYKRVREQSHQDTHIQNLNTEHFPLPSLTLVWEGLYRLSPLGSTTITRTTDQRTHALDTQLRSSTVSSTVALFNQHPLG